MKLKQSLPCLLAVATLTGCSSDSSSTSTPTPSTNTPQITIPTYDYQLNTDDQLEDLDGMSSATVLDEEDGYGDTSYQIFYQSNSRDELLLDRYPTADALVFFALSEPYRLDSDVPVDVVHQTVKEALGSRYDSVRNSFQLIGQSAYYSELASSEDPASVQAYYSMGFDDLANGWFEGLSAEEISTIKSSILQYYDINDLLNVNHYTKLEGIQDLIIYADIISSVHDYIQDQSAETQNILNQLVERVLHDRGSITVDDYTTMITTSLTVRELMNAVEDLETNLPGEILQGEWNLTPKRVGYFSADVHYGMSVIESIQSEVGTATYRNVTETRGSDNVTSKTARLYLPKIEGEGYFVLTIQEIVFDEENIYSYVNVESASISTFNTLLAQDLHRTNVSTLTEMYGLTVESLDPLPEEESQDDHGEEEDHDDHGEDDLDVDGMSSATPEFVTLSTPNGSGDVIEVIVPHFPEKVAILDYNFFDFAIAIGFPDRFERLLIQDNLPSNFQSYLLGDNNLSDTMNFNDLSEIIAFAPDVIFISQQFAFLYEELSAIAPVVLTLIDENDPYGSYLENIARFSSVFAVQENSDGFTDGYTERLNSLREKASGKTGAIVSVSEGTLVSESSYGSLIFQGLGMTDFGGTITLADVETLDYLFVLSDDGSLVLETAVPVVSLDRDAWVHTSSGLLGMGQMISDLERGIS
ncbi:MAG: hypothetical protein R3Y63_12130 [Eubacteriales bacterium]